MGAVYRARQRHLDRLVALKILPPELGKEPGFEERFAREARSLAKLDHPNIVRIHDFGKVDDLYYLVMEYVDGANIRQLIQQGHLAPAQALAIVPQICEALQFAHDEGIVHRDIKPENILVSTKGRVKIADFGLAKIVGASPSGAALTATQQVLGTPSYMAPEQMKGAGTVDHRADIYSLGVVFYEMLTGELPIGKFELPSNKVQVDVRLDAVVLRTLESQPERRYQHAGEVGTDVEAIASSQWNVREPRQPATGRGDQLSSPAAGAPRRLKALFWLFVCCNIAILIIARSFTGDDFKVDAIASCSLILSVGLYWFVSVWFKIDAYPGREADIPMSMSPWRRLFQTAGGWTVLACLLGIVTTVIPWASTSSFVQANRQFAGVWSELGFFTLCGFTAFGVVFGVSLFSAIVPRLPRVAVVFAGLVLTCVSTFYIVSNLLNPVADVFDSSPELPWSQWPQRPVMPAAFDDFNRLNRQTTITIEFGSVLAVIVSAAVIGLGLFQLREERRAALSRAASGVETAAAAR